MSFQNQFTKTTTDANLMETVHHGSAEYPFRYYYENIALFDFKCIDWHWHSELEFIYIESGNVVFDIGTVHFELNEGNGIMINSKILLAGGLLLVMYFYIMNVHMKKVFGTNGKD